MCISTTSKYIFYSDATQGVKILFAFLGTDLHAMERECKDGPLAFPTCRFNYWLYV